MTAAIMHLFDQPGKHDRPIHRPILSVQWHVAITRRVKKKSDSRVCQRAANSFCAVYAAVLNATYI